MQVREKTRREIEARFEEMGDYVRMDYLLSCLKQSLDFDTRKFVLVKLAGLYEHRKMYSNAGKMVKSAAEINTTLQNKVDDFMKAAQLFVRGGSFEEAEVCVKNALSLAGAGRKEELSKQFRDVYRTQAKVYLTNDKRNHAMKVYERLMKMDLGIEERHDVVEKLSELYNQLGKVRELSLLKKNLGNK